MNELFPMDFNLASEQQPDPAPALQAKIDASNEAQKQAKLDL